MFQCGGIIVDVNLSDHSTVISFSDYYEGAAPALLVNHTPWATISYRQRSEVNTLLHICYFIAYQSLKAVTFSSDTVHSVLTSAFLEVLQVFGHKKSFFCLFSVFLVVTPCQFPDKFVFQLIFSL